MLTSRRDDESLPLALAATALLVLVSLREPLGGGTAGDLRLTAAVAAVVAVSATRVRARPALALGGIGWLLLTGTVQGRNAELALTGWGDLARAVVLLTVARSGVLLDRLALRGGPGHSRGMNRSPRRAAATSATSRPVSTSRRPSRS